jgi:hypothetical protein
MIEHFYKCLGCGKRHPYELQAMVCCCVVQELWECSECGEQFATAGKAERHLCQGKRQRDEGKSEAGDLTVGQSFAAGWGNFSTP